MDTFLVEICTNLFAFIMNSQNMALKGKYLLESNNTLHRLLIFQIATHNKI